MIVFLESFVLPLLAIELVMSFPVMPRNEWIGNTLAVLVAASVISYIVTMMKRDGR